MGKQRQLLSMLGLAPSVVRSLQTANFLYDEDVKELTPTELYEASGLRIAECCEVLRLAQAAPVKATTVLDMIEHSPDVGHVTSFCSALDGLLGGGLPLGAVTEVAGTPGIGKTQLCIQACVSVQWPSSVGGTAGEAVYIDAEGSMAATRLREMAQYAVTHYGRAAPGGGGACGDTEGAGAAFTVEGILRRVHYFRCLSQLSVVATIKRLPELLLQHRPVRLIVLDSVAFHLRHDVPDNRVRTGLLCAVTQDLVQLATKYSCAVIVTNQMTTRLISNAGGSNKSNFSESSSELIPALGASWGHCPTIRLVLRWCRGQRTATLVKAPHRANGSATYQITAAGIRDCTPATDSPPDTAHHDTDGASDDNCSRKRRRQQMDSEPAMP